MNPFALTIIAVFTLAGVYELWYGHGWLALFYFSSAFLNVCVVKMR
jgi:hypothetical protein